MTVVSGVVFVIVYLQDLPGQGQAQGQCPVNVYLIQQGLHSLTEHLLFYQVQF